VREGSEMGFERSFIWRELDIVYLIVLAWNKVADVVKRDHGKKSCG
jgi:hypothetical protein